MIAIILLVVLLLAAAFSYYKGWINLDFLKKNGDAAQTSPGPAPAATATSGGNGTTVTREDTQSSGPTINFDGVAKSNTEDNGGNTEGYMIGGSSFL